MAALEPKLQLSVVLDPPFCLSRQCGCGVSNGVHQLLKLPGRTTSVNRVNIDVRGWEVLGRKFWAGLFAYMHWFKALRRLA